MKILNSLVKRNCKLFFKDKGLFFGAMIAPLILLFLYATFLSNVYRSSFVSVMPAGTPERLVNGVVGGQLLSSLLAVCCVTVAFCSNMLMVRDKVTNAKNDLVVSPVSKPTLALSYYIATVITTLIICYVATAVCFIYIACIGWYLSFVDVILILVDVFILVMFGTALSSIINSFLSSEGQISAVETIISASYGFLCGAYMPISQFNVGLQKAISLLPGTYGTALVRNHTLNGAFKEMLSIGWQPEVVENIRNSIDCNLYFFGTKVEISTMYIIMFATIAVLIGIFIAISLLKGKLKFPNKKIKTIKHKSK